MGIFKKIKKILFNIEEKPSFPKWENALPQVVENANEDVRIRDLQEKLEKEIEERKRLEDLLGITETRLRLLVDQMPAVLWTMDQNLRFNLSVGSALESLGLKPNQVVGMHLFDFFKSSDENFLPIATHLKALQGEEVTYEIEWGGEWFYSYLGPWRDKDQKIIGMIGIGINITERKKYEEKLKKANKELSSLSQLKSNFNSMISHELRTPLSSIREGVSIILDEIDGELNEHQKKILQIVKSNTDRLSRLVLNVLDHTMIESGKMKMFFSSVNLNELIIEVCKWMETIALRKGIRILTYLPPENVYSVCDPEKMKLVLINLIDNALKYTASENEVKVELFSDSESVQIEIEDFGIGIQEEDQKKIFSIFEQASSEEVLNKGGFGIGLAICKYILEQHQGKIHVTSELGSGSRFKIIFPQTLQGIKEVS